MPSTYTTNLGIEKIGTGEQSGTWGTTTNTNLDLIDQAVNGVVQVTLAAAGTSGSPNSLPINDGSASDGRNKFIEFTDGGDLGATAYVQLTPNDAEKVAFFRNSLTGGRSVIVFQGTYNASNDFEIPSGADVVLKFDGAGAGATVTQVFEDLTISAVTLSSGVTASSILDEDNMASDSDTALATQQSIKAYVDSQVGTVDTLAEILANGNTTGGNDILFADNDKAVFGAGSDLQIYHDGSDSYITHTTGGNFFINDDGAGYLMMKGSDLYFRNPSNVDMLHAQSGGFVKLYHNGVAKLATTATGIDVTGTVTATGTSVFASLDISGDIDVDGTTNLDVVDIDGAVDMASTLTVSGLTNLASPVQVRNATQNFNGGLSTEVNSGIINFGLNEGSANRFGGSYTQANQGGFMHFDTRSGEPLFQLYGRTAGTADASGSILFQIDSTGNTVFNETGIDADFRVESDTNTHALFVEGDGTGVGINTSDPQEALHVTGSMRLDGNNNGITSGEAVNQLIFKDTDTTTGGGQTMGQIDFVTADADAPGVSSRISGVADSSTTGQGRLTLFTGAAGTLSNNITMAAGSVAINEGGADMDFRVESDTNTHALFVEGDNTNNRIKLGMGTGTITNPYGQDNFTDLNINGTWGGMISFKLGGTEKGFIGQRNSGNGDMIVGASSGQSLFLASNGNTSRIELTDAGNVVVNPTGADNDFRVQSNGNANMLFVDASVDRVGVGATPMTNGSTFQVTSDSTESTNMQLTLRGASDTNKQMIMGFDTTANTAHITTQIAGSAPTPLIFKTGDVVFNEASSDSDFRVESNDNANMLFVDGGNNRVGIGKAAASQPFEVGVFSAFDTGMIVNESGADSDFRVESDTNTHMLFVDAGNNAVGIGTSSPSRKVSLADSVNGYNLELQQTSAYNSGNQSGIVFSAPYNIGGSVTDLASIRGGKENATDEDFGGKLAFYTRANGGSDTERMRIDSSGRVTMPYQPAFNVNPLSDQNNIAINTPVTVIFNSEVFDVGSNFASNTFTAPVTGKYQLNLALRLHNIDTAADFYQIKFLTSNRSYLSTADYGGLSSNPNYWTEAFSVLADMDANDTVSITVSQSGGSVQTDIHVETTFSGYLVA
jgi:hypothetical protein